MRGIMAPPIRVVIVDDYQGTVDGLYYRLSQSPSIHVVGVALYAADMEQLLAQSQVDVLLLDVGLPISAEDSSLYDTPRAIKRLRGLYPDLAILIISMHHESALIRQVLDAGACGYILKEEGYAIRQIASIVESVAAGGVYLSDKASKQLNLGGESEVNLTKRQLQILSLASEQPNLTSYEIARKLGIADSTVRNQLSRAYLNLGVRNCAAAIIRARELGLLSPYQGNLSSGEN